MLPRVAGGAEFLPKEILEEEGVEAFASTKDTPLGLMGVTANLDRAIAFRRCEGKQRRQLG